jgi:hypothetical protein
MVGVDGYSRAGEWRSVTAIFGAAQSVPGVGRTLPPALTDLVAALGVA